MHARFRRGPEAIPVMTALLVLGVLGTTAWGDEPGILGRLFRGGGGSPPPRSAPAREPAPAYGAPVPTVAAPTPPLLPAETIGPATPTPTDNAAPARIRPQPRVSRAATEADPIVTRVALGRADDGKQFGMFLQVYADGTVIDGEGVHRVAPDALRPVMQALQSPELSRINGHCGGPPSDFIEQVHMVVYERRFGVLRANSFSFSGNTAGCDPSVRHLHQALEALQTRLSSPGGSVADPAAVAGATPAPTALGAAPPPPLIPESSSPTISLTPESR